jgi:hypothetical protein
MKIQAKLIAPCGMNCALCHAYQREKNRCDGCRTANRECHFFCQIASCPHLKNGFCSTKCEQFPCHKMQLLDKRYRTKYNASPFENLATIEKSGVRKLVISEEKKWECKECGGLICMHKGFCISCGVNRSYTNRH